MKKIESLWLVVLCLWQFPQFIVGTILWLFLGKTELIESRHFNYCFKGEKMRGGISLGPLCFVSPQMSKFPTHVAHELDGHTKDSLIFGPLYLVFIGIPSILWAMTYRLGNSCYYKFYTERWANRHAGLIVVDDCELMFKKTMNFGK